MDLATRTVRATIPVPGPPVRVVLSPDGRTAFVATEADFPAVGTCQIISLQTDALGGAIPCFPMQLTGRAYSDYVDRAKYTYLPFVVTPDVQRLVLASFASDVRVYDVASRSLVPGAPEAWAATVGSVNCYNVLSGALLESRPVSGQASFMRVASNGEPVALLDGWSASPRLWARGTETALPELVTRLVGDGPCPPDLLPTPFALAASGNVALLSGVRDRLVAV